MRLVDQWDRARAEEKSLDLLRHQANRTYDALSDLDEAISKKEPDAVISAASRVSNMAGKVQHLAATWKGLLQDWKANEPKSESAPEAPGLPSAADLDTDAAEKKIVADQVSPF